MVKNADCIFSLLIVYGSLPYYPVYWYVISRIEGININFLSYRSVSYMRGPNDLHCVEIQKSVKSTDRFGSFLVMSESLTCILIYQGIAGLDVFTGCLLFLPNGYYLCWILFLFTESELFLVGVFKFQLFTVVSYPCSLGCVQV